MIEIENVELYSRYWDRHSRSYVIDTNEHLDPKQKYLIKEKTLINLNNWLENNRVAELQNEDIVYFCPNTKMSRSKFRDWALHKGIKVTLDPSKATILVLDKKILNISIGDRLYLTSKNKILVETLDESAPVYYIFNEYELYKYINIGLDFILSIPVELSTKQYILVEDLAEQMQPFKMDFEAFKNIYSMLKSKEKNTIKVAYEMMSNYKMKETPLMFVIFKLIHSFNASALSAVSLASLKDFLIHDLSYVDYYTSLDKIVSILEYFFSTNTNEELDEEVLNFYFKDLFGSSFQNLKLEYISFIKRKVEKEDKSEIKVVTF